MKAKKVTMGNSTFPAALISHFKACPDEKVRFQARKHQEKVYKM